MSTATTSKEESRHTVSRRLAAEDIRVGSFITVIQQISEVAPFLWFSDISAADREQPILFRHTPADSGEPHKVLAVCLPFVFVQDLRNNTQTFDLRRCEVTLLADHYVDVVRKKRWPLSELKCGKSRKKRKKKKSK